MVEFLAVNSIGIFDSGIGGLCVLRHIQLVLPQTPLVYLADQINVPYGPRSKADVQRLSEGITRFLLDQGAAMIVVACNTASAAALSYLRETFPEVPFVGMEPAVKPGARATKTGKVGVMATAGTFQSQRYASLMHRYAQDVQLFENPCVGLVESIEAGKTDASETKALLEDVLGPMINAGMDTLILGCTHYPFIQPLIRKIIGDEIAIIDPAPAVARQTARLWGANCAVGVAGPLVAYTTGPVSDLQASSQQLLGYLGCAFETRTVAWQENILTFPS